MKVKLVDRYNASYGRVMDLEDALEPHLRAYECDGATESANALAGKTAKAVAKLGALLVERRLISLDEAVACFDVYETVEEVDSDNG